MTLLDRPRPLHFLAFGHSNQSTFRRETLQDIYDGVSVPGTIATYFQQATGGFVLALDKPYFLDPRTPLFQGNVQAVRASFLTLAKAHGPAIHTVVSRAKDADIRLWDEIQNIHDASELSSSWLEYQRNYVEESFRAFRLLCRASSEGVLLDHGDLNSLLIHIGCALALNRKSGNGPAT